MSNDVRFFEFLKDRIGLDVTSVGEAIIERAVRQRCMQANVGDHDAYWHLLQHSVDEQQALIEAVIVPETWFFRYPESFVTLGKLAMTKLIQLNGLRPLRILSLPCSTGEEPYSVAMALFDAGINPQQFKVDALDISPLSIQRARHGVYGKNSFRGNEIDFRERYFTQVEDGYRIVDRVRERVAFQAGNLLDPGLSMAHSAYDFVFCRNLLIYFDVATQRQSFEALKRMTREDGVLFIGPAEGSLLSRMGMSSLGVAQSFAFRRRKDVPQESTSEVKPAVLVNAPSAVSQAPAPVPRREKVLPRAFPVTPRASSSASPGAEAAELLDSIASLANEGKGAEAKAACELYLKHHEPVASVFYWLGLLSEVAGDVAAAQGFYRKALYLQPQHAEALAQLASLLASRGDEVGARRLQERAARGMNKEGRNR